MATPTDFQPAGWHTVTPRIIVHGAEELVEFVKNVFGASGQYHSQAPAELRLGDSIIMISDAGVHDTMTACLCRSHDSRRKMRLLWLPIGVTCLIGVSCGLPL